MDNIQNLQNRDPFAVENELQGGGSSGGFVHIRIQQRNGRKTLTTVQGLNSDFDLKKIVKACKKDFACNGTVVEHPEYGEVIQLQGDQRQKVSQFLTKVGLAKEEQVKTQMTRLLSLGAQSSFIVTLHVRLQFITNGILGKTQIIPNQIESIFNFLVKNS